MTGTGRRAVRATGIDGLTDACGIHPLELPAPECGPEQVLIRVDAVAVNHVDTLVRSGAYSTRLGFPVAVGRDAVGTVETVGGADTGFAAGDRVWTNSLGFDSRPGATAELVAADAERVYRLPDGIDAVEAAACLHPCATAALAVDRDGQSGPGEMVLVAGGAGQVGSAAVVLAVRRGARVLVSASARDAGYCRELGASEVFDYRDPQLEDRLREAAPDGLDVQIDTSGTNNLGRAVDLAALRGRIVVLSGPVSTSVLPAGRLYMRDASIRGFAISNASVPDLAAAAETVNAMLSSGAWRPRHITRLGFADAGKAHALLESGDARGTRIVLLPPT